MVQIDNNSFLQKNKFRFSINRAPTISFFCQSISIPAVEISTTTVATPPEKIYLPGTQFTFSPLLLEFKVDEDLVNYLEIFNWMSSLVTNYGYLTEEQIQTSNVYSDATIHSLTNSSIANKKITFIDIFPRSLSEIAFNSTGSDIEYNTCIAEFYYRKFNIS